MDMYARVNSVLAANPVLHEVYTTGFVPLPSGELRSACENGMPLTECQQLYQVVCREQPSVSLEVGMAFGLSTLAICQGLIETGGNQHIVMDPYQESDYQGTALRHLERAGLRHLADFYLESSHEVLPRLEAAGTCVDFAFVDGIHLVDYTMVEFFYIDRMLRRGGLLVFDDLQLPSIRKVVRFAVANRGYRDESHSPRTGRVRLAGRRFRRILRGMKAFGEALRFAIAPEHTELLSLEIGWPRENGLAILRKIKDDDRAWKHYVDF